MKEKKRQEIFVEKGMADRQRIVLAGAGDQEVHLNATRVLMLTDLSSSLAFLRATSFSL